MIHEQDNVFTLDTRTTTYLFRVEETGHLEHLYYGRRLRDTSSIDTLIDKHTLPIGNGTAYDSLHPTLFLDNLCLECSSPGKGDYRESSIVIEYGPGLQTCDFIYKEYRIIPGKPRTFSGIPASYGTKDTCTTLEIVLKEKLLPLRLQLIYTIFEDCDVITRRTTLYNDGQDIVTIRNLASLQLDLPESDWNFVTFDGTWARERYRNERSLTPGIMVNDSKTGVSGAVHNSCVFLRRPSTSESRGECIGCNLIYSGNHRELVETSPYGKVRLMTGVNPATFCWKLSSNERFQTPEAILTYSAEGLNGASRHFHKFVNEHVVRGTWKNRLRPVLVNNWEATYFNFSESKLLDLAHDAADFGAELFVLDDGWFGSREDDTTSLGDWTVNTKKLPSGIADLSKKIHRMGLLFGLWVEPEMISIESDLYRAHPEWMIAIPDRTPSPGRNQFILDLTREDVRNYLVTSLSDIWHLARVDYVKWDMNRVFSDLFSHNREIRNHGEFLHRYVLGLYDVLDKLTKLFPDMLFESCASGGNRFDLGMLCFMPQTWTSDNTDVLCRMYIQEGTSCGYPLSTMGAHVSASPNHQTLRKSDIESRFNVAAFGVLGYELDITRLDDQQKEAIKDQIEFYKEHRTVLQYGEFFRIVPASGDTNEVIWVAATPDRSEMLVLWAQKLNQPNPGCDILKVPVANPAYDYEVTPRKQKVSIKMFGDLINRNSPVKMKNDGFLQQFVSQKYSLDSEIEHYFVPGDMLAYGGIRLNQQFGGTGFDAQTRVLGDFGSRLYYIRRVEKDQK